MEPSELVKAIPVAQEEFFLRSCYMTAFLDSEINVFHRFAHFVIHDSVDKFYRRIRGNMLYLNDSSEAVRIALIDFDWWNSRGRMA